MAIRAHTHIGETKTSRAASGDAARARKAAGKKRFTQPKHTPRWSKAAPITFKTRSTLDDAIAAVIAGCRDHWQLNLPAALDGRNAEGVHQVRVGLRRFRSALSLFKAFMPENQRDWLNTEGKWLANQLGAVRDLDVLLADLEKRSRKNDESAAALGNAVRSARTHARTSAMNALRGPRMRRFAARVETWLSGHGWYVDDAEIPDVGAFAREALNKRMKKIQAVAARADKLTVPERHELRIAVKKLRYSLEFLMPVLSEKRAQRANAVLKRVQDSLGHLNDLDVAERTLALVAARATPAERRLMKKAGDALKSAHRKAAAKAEPETERLCHKLVKLPAF
ncbi:MAG: CHAD domain-containing protein [Proteobacteria bacterium]|nr:CHAD domain-containing protein [Pseudomonadota bacterium]